MQKLQRFFDVFWKSATDPGYYKDILKAKFSFSLKYLAFLLFLFSLVPTVQFVRVAFPLLNTLPTHVSNFTSTVRSWYPAELEVTVHNGALTTNVKEPYTLTAPGWKGSVEGEDFDHLLVIDTGANAEDFPNYRSLILVTKRAIFYRSNRGYQFFPLSSLQTDVVINKEAYGKLVDYLSPYFRYVQPVMTGLVIVGALLLPFAVTWFGLMGKLLYLLVFSLLTLVLAKVLRVSCTYSQGFRLGMHALTLPMVVTLVAGAFSYALPFGLYSLIFLVWMGIVLSRLPKFARKH